VVGAEPVALTAANVRPWKLGLAVRNDRRFKLARDGHCFLRAS